nr:ribonuclease H-like domain-containing protein [Tanacetum cinerariifolium]
MVDGDKPPKDKRQASDLEGSNIDQYDPLFLHSNDTRGVPLINFKLEVGHHNDTKVVVTHVGSLRLTDQILIRDVLVVPGYESEHLDDSEPSEAVSDIEENETLDENNKESEGDDKFYQEFNEMFEKTNVVPDSQSVVNSRRSFRKTSMPKKFSDFKVDTKVKYSIDKQVNYSNLSLDNFNFSTSLNKIVEPITFDKALKDIRWVEAINLEMDALNKNELAFGVLRYLKNALGKGIYFNKCDDLSLRACVDSDLAQYKVTRKSVTGYSVFIGKSLVSWKSKKQSMLSKSLVEAEYKVMNNVTCESTKHFKIELFFIKEKVADGVVKTIKVKYADNTTDIFIKGLSVVDHNRYLAFRGNTRDLAHLEKKWTRLQTYTNISQDYVLSS